jgi:putative hydrolase of the HAD superfamily
LEDRIQSERETAVALQEKPKRYVSFDLDGTLVDLAFTNLVWHRGIPELYAQRAGLDLSKAQALVLGEYQKVGDGALEWYDIAHWFRYFDLPGGWEDLLKRYAYAVHVYPEVHRVLRRLRESYSLIVLSNAAREFIDVEIRVARLDGFFNLVISATSDFGLVKKSPAFYRNICELLGVNPGTMIHIGDHWEFDYLIPRGMGMIAFYLNRQGERSGGDVLKDLSNLPDLLDGKERHGDRRAER